MVNVKFILKQNWPLAGAMRKEGEMIVEGSSAIDGLTPDKILNAVLQGAVRVEVSAPPKKKAAKK